jgi:hypothetical protein
MARSIYDGLTKEQAMVLREFAAAHGRKWRSRLIAAWKAPTRALHPVLRKLRETHGAEWLTTYQIAHLGQKRGFPPDTIVVKTPLTGTLGRIDSVRAVGIELMNQRAVV